MIELCKWTGRSGFNPELGLKVYAGKELELEQEQYERFLKLKLIKKMKTDKKRSK